jgi:pimeloyl-ACP methyl ester carboxylesterase
VINFDRYVKPLVDKGYEVMAFDAPAHGRSTGKTINAVVFRDFLHHLYEQYGPIDSFIAHSFGGLCLCLALEKIPHNEKHRLVLIAPAVETTRAIDNFFKFIRLDDEVRKEFDRLILELGDHPPSWFSIARAAPHIKARVLFLQDKQDPLTPFDDVEPIIKKCYPNFQFLISDGLGHRRIYRDSKSVKAVIDFL